jgi:hypothetical protein
MQFKSSSGVLVIWIDALGVFASYPVPRLLLTICSIEPSYRFNSAELFVFLKAIIRHHETKYVIPFCRMGIKLKHHHPLGIRAIIFRFEQKIHPS